MPTIREEQPADCDAVNAVHIASFPGAAEAQLVSALRRAGRLSASIVAVEAGWVVGHVAFSPLRVLGATSGVGLGPLAVLPGSRRRRVAERLVRHGLKVCAGAGATFVVVLGSPGYYARFGFQPARLWQLRDEYAGGDAFQALELVTGSMPRGALVQYAPEFAALAV